MRGASRSQAILLRQWQLVRALSSSRYGATLRQLIETTGSSRATVYRDLRFLEAAGVPLTSHTTNGEARYRLLRDAELPALVLTAREVAAIRLARGELEPLAGSGLVAELDALLARYRPADAQQSLRFAPRREGRPEVMAVVERALVSRRRARMSYRAASRGGAPALVHVEPFLLNVSDGEPYFRAYCVERGGERTYKLARVAEIQLTDELAAYLPEPPAHAAFEHAVKAWSGAPTRVRVRLDADVAWLADEYRLVADQRLEPGSDASVVVDARVEGVVEAARWVLAWGGAAEALEPAALRSMVRAELAKALNKYEGPGPAKASGSRGPSTRTRRTSLTHRETRRA